MKKSFSFFQIIPPLLLIILLSACGTPVLNSLNPGTGTRGSIAIVNGSNLTGANVYWDYGLPSQAVIPSGFINASFFTVPLGAAFGAHPVKIAIGNNFSSNTVSFTVVDGTVRPKPRIDYFSCDDFSIDATGKATFILFISGANMDVGSTILVNGTDVGAVTSQVMHNNSMTATDPSTLGYPIFNYSMIWTIIDQQPAGSNLSIQVKNLDGTLSDAKTYAIAASMALLDSDGDGLLDDWEINGYDANGDGKIDVDLPGLGANPHHRDLFVEVDWMNGFAPDNSIWTTVESAYANAPILNSDGVPGIAIHIDRGQAGAGGGGGSVIPASNYIEYDGNASSYQQQGQTTADFYTLKSKYFDPNRLKIYRYCIFADDNGYQPGSSGRAENIWANDFFVTLGAWSPSGGTTTEQTGTFMHEFGHTLNLRHGGFEDDNYKPSYNSIMSYEFQIYGIDINCNNAGGGVFTYSQGVRADLNESTLNEKNGVCDHNAIDWNGNGILETSVSKDINNDGAITDLKDFSDWGNLQLDFTGPGSNWGNN